MLKKICLISVETVNRQGFSAVSFWAVRYGITDKEHQELSKDILKSTIL